MIQPRGVVCPGCSNPYPVASMAVQLENRIRAHISRYYLGYTICDDDTCGARTRMMGVYGRRCLGLMKEGCKGTVKLEVSCVQIEDGTDIKYSDSMLYNQLLYYSSLFDVERALTKARGTARYGELPTRFSSFH